MNESRKEQSTKSSQQSSLKLATELYEKRSKVFCVGLIIHLLMYLTGCYFEKVDIR